MCPSTTATDSPSTASMIPSWYRLLELRETLEELKVRLRLAQDVKAFGNFNAFAQALTRGHRQAK